MRPRINRQTAGQKPRKANGDSELKRTGERTYGDTCRRAAELLTGERDTERGDPRPVYERAAAIYEAVTSQACSAKDVIVMLMCIKMGRESIRHSPDNLIDLAGYADILNYLA